MKLLVSTRGPCWAVAGQDRHFASQPHGVELNHPCGLTVDGTSPSASMCPSPSRVRLRQRTAPSRSEDALIRGGHPGTRCMTRLTVTGNECRRRVVRMTYEACTYRVHESTSRRLVGRVLTTTIPYTIASELFQIAIRVANTFGSDKQILLSGSVHAICEKRLTQNPTTELCSKTDLTSDHKAFRMDGPAVLSMPPITAPQKSAQSPQPQSHSKSNQELQVGTVSLYGIHIVSLVIEGQERLCLAQISNTLLKQFSYNEIHNRRVALGITCVQCTPVQLEILRRAGAMPVSSRRCGMITRREAERLCKSFLGDNAPPRLPEDFAFSVHHECAWGCRGAFLPARYNSSRAKCIKCAYCGLFFSPNKFIFHSHRIGPSDKYVQPDAANFNSWRRHMKLSGNPPDEVVHAWEDVKAMFNGGTRKRLLNNPTSRESPSPAKQPRSSPTAQIPTLVPSPTHPRVPPFPELPLPLSRSLVMNYVWQHHQTPGFPFSPYALPWLAKRGPVLFPGALRVIFGGRLFSFFIGCSISRVKLGLRFDKGVVGPLPPPISGSSPTEPLIPAVNPSLHQSAFRPVIRGPPIVESVGQEQPSDTSVSHKEDNSDDEVDIETTEDDPVTPLNITAQNLHSVSNSATSSHSGRNSPQCWSPPRETVSDHLLTHICNLVVMLKGTKGKGRDAFRPGPASGLISKAALDRDTIGKLGNCICRKRRNPSTSETNDNRDHQDSTINQLYPPLNPSRITTRIPQFFSLLCPSSSNTIDTLSREIHRSIPFDPSETQPNINDRYTRTFSLLVTVDIPSGQVHRDRGPEARSNSRIQRNRDTQRDQERQAQREDRESTSKKVAMGFEDRLAKIMTSVAPVRVSSPTVAVSRLVTGIFYVKGVLEETKGKGWDAFRPGPASALIEKITSQRTCHHITRSRWKGRNKPTEDSTDQHNRNKTHLFNASTHMDGITTP
ncbi:SKI family transcriptional corepressor 1 homolog-B [Eufriesea mexicana]|uniref:SKI family transcriptional corepressor 1 homolog-B n=1 Tax=Eufriesea mexicana TaxID=516756 RepID=A0A310SHW7_9HYME|nr:SKI family transcriptional corepressor 1 homolog-B [Eufriesea mexicana]